MKALPECLGTTCWPKTKCYYF